MTTFSTTVSMLNSRQVQDSSLPQRLDPLRRGSLPKITGRKLRTPRKFVVTDVSDEELDALKPSASYCVSLSDIAGQEQDKDKSVGCMKDMGAVNVSVRKGKTQVKGRFTITDLSPESPETPLEREGLSISMGSTPSRKFEKAPRRSSRKMSTRRPFQSAGDIRPSVDLTESSSPQQQQQQQQQHEQERPMFASFERPMVSSPSSRSLCTSLPAHSMNTQTSETNNQTPIMFDNHLKFLEKETFEMRSTLEKMVATNSQWIEALVSAGLVQGKLREVSVLEPVVAVESPFEQNYRKVEKAYMELQAKYDAVCQKSERMEMKNAMLEIRLHQQINRSTMLRSQLDKLTHYTEKLICESSEPTLHDYNSDLNSIFGEHSEAHSPTADETSSGEYGFNDNVLKSRRQRWHNMDEECMSNTSTEGESFRKTSSPVPYERDNENNQYYSDVEPMSANGHGRLFALESLLDDQINELRQSLRSKKEDTDAPVSVNGSLDSMTVCPSVTNFAPNDDDECEVHDQTVHSVSVKQKRLNADLLKHSNSVASLNYSTVSSTSSLAGYGLHLATMAQSKSGYFSSMAATTLFGPHPEPYPNASSQQNDCHDDETVYNVLSPENLRFHDCQSLLKAAEERSSQPSSRRRGFPFTTNKQPASLPEANEVSERIQTTGSSLFERFAVRRRKPVD
ncbi:unnamed protein product [Peronospora belbahrii]|uniref:Up-regulated during septation protein 1 domain-containing protein n=1 Tax=Peronospora belbahrii TaxID=622444 RepID=A0AAU9KYE4_9STRA|nr:unnamed protein product [Peronospora belbahrii]